MRAVVQLNFGDDLYNNLFLPRLKRFRFTDRDDKSDKVELTFRNDDLQLLDWYPSGLEVWFRYGWVDELSQPRTLKIKKIKWAGTSDLMVEGFSAEFEMDKEQKTRTFEDTNYAAIAEFIAREQGYAFDLTIVEHDDVIFDTVPQMGETDAHFLRRLAKELDYAFWADENEFHFHERKYGAKPRLVLQLREGDLIGNIRSLDGDLDLIRSPESVKKKGYNPRKKKPIEADATGSDSGPVAGKYEPGSFPCTRTEKDLQYNEKWGTFDVSERSVQSDVQTKQEPSTAQNENEAKQEATKALRKKKNRRIKFTAKLNPGHSRYTAKTTIELSGARILDGPSYISEAVTEIGQGTFTTELRLIKGYLGKKPKKGAGAAETKETEGEANTASADNGFDTVIELNDDGYHEVWQEERNPAPTKLKGGYY